MNVQQKKTRQPNVRITKHSGATNVAVEKPMSITYSEFVSVALVIQHAMRMRHTVICALPYSTIYFHIIT
jgi:hypothetical protein